MRTNRRSTRPSLEILDNRMLLSGLASSGVVGPVLSNVGVASVSPGSVPTSQGMVLLGNQFYVAPEGSPSGDGSIDHPWDLQTALGQPAAVHPGDVIWVRGGTYVGNFQSSLSGTANSPIIVDEYPGERATLDGVNSTTLPTLAIDGQNSWFCDLEITNSVDPEFSD